MAGIGQSTDILDEDAADLQFPKDDLIIEEDCATSVHQEVCIICRNAFNSAPRIICAECRDIELCLQCFALGLETQTHRSFHRYRVSRLKIPMHLDSDWSLEEDRDLLNGLLESGYGNYVDLGRKIKRSYDDIRRRIDRLCELDKAPLQACLEVVQKPLVKYWPTVHLEAPPRFPTNSHSSKSFAGYNAPRGDFDVEFDNMAEDILAGIQNPEDDDDVEEDSDVELSNELRCALVSSYNERLKERFRRKRVIREHGILLRSFSLIMSRYNPKLFIFMQLLDSDDYDTLLDGLNLEEGLCKELIRLSRYRSQGIKRLKMCEMYDNLYNMRVEAKRLEANLKFSTNQSQQPSERKQPPPMDMTMFPMFSKLTLEERDLCANIRVLPETFLEIKRSLINEFVNKGFLPLKTARQLIKIDVNKTRKIYNFLRDNSIISESPRL